MSIAIEYMNRHQTRRTTTTRTPRFTKALDIYVYTKLLMDKHGKPPLLFGDRAGYGPRGIIDEERMTVPEYRQALCLLLKLFDPGAEKGEWNHPNRKHFIEIIGFCRDETTRASFAKENPFDYNSFVAYLIVERANGRLENGEAPFSDEDKATIKWAGLTAYISPFYGQHIESPKLVQ